MAAILDFRVKMAKSWTIYPWNGFLIIKLVKTDTKNFPKIADFGNFKMVADFGLS